MDHPTRTDSPTLTINLWHEPERGWWWEDKEPGCEPIAIGPFVSMSRAKENARSVFQAYVLEFAMGKPAQQQCWARQLKTA